MKNLNIKNIVIEKTNVTATISLQREDKFKFSEEVKTMMAIVVLCGSSANVMRQIFDCSDVDFDMIKSYKDKLDSILDDFESDLRLGKLNMAELRHTFK